MILVESGTMPRCATIIGDEHKPTLKIQIPSELLSSKPPCHNIEFSMVLHSQVDLFGKRNLRGHERTLKRNDK